MIIRRLLRYLRRFAVRTLARLAMVVRTPEPLALIYGAPDYEENSLVTAVRLRARFTGRIIVLCQDPDKTTEYLRIVADSLGTTSLGIECEPMRRLSVLWRYYGQAQLVFYTHGLFFSPRSLGKRVHVNLWHGTGPKLASNHNFPSVFDADALSSASAVWGKSTANSLRMSQPRVIAGNARSDLLVQAKETKTKLGWSETVVLWMPTYRESASVSIGTLREGQSFAQESAQELRAAAERHGIRLIIKPHPFDAAAMRELGLEVLTSEEIWDSGITVSQSIAAADAVISDYSSAWVDALVAETPVGLWCLDIERYGGDRGFNVPLMTEVARDLFIDNLDDFFARIAEHGAFRPQEQREVCARLKLHSGPQADHMLDQVRELAQREKRVELDFRE